MHFLNLLPLALSATAFLVPAEIKEHVEVVKTIPAHATHQEVYMKCTGTCLDNKDIKSTGGDFTTLYAKLAVDDGKVTYNGRQIWPGTIAPPLTVKQFNPDEEDGPELPVSSSLEYKPDQVLVDEHTHMVIHPVLIEILAVGNNVVHMSKQTIIIAETEAGIVLLPTQYTAYKPSPYTDSCTTVWCRVSGTITQKFDEWRQAASRKIKGLKGCQGRKGRHGRPNVKGGPAKFGPGSTLRPEGGFRGQHHGQQQGHQHGHHHHHAGHRVMAAIRSAIMAGIAGFAIGMVFISLVRLTRWVFGYRQPEYIIVEEVEVEEGRASMDGPPKYEEVYREAQVSSDDEKKELLQ